MTAEGFGRCELSLQDELFGDDQVHSTFEVFLGLSVFRGCFHRMQGPTACSARHEAAPWKQGQHAGYSWHSRMT